MKKARDGAVKLFFTDASHFVHGCDFLGGIYCRVRRFVKTFSGRQRYNVLGALDFVSKEVITVANDTYITATQVCEMLRKLAARFPNQEIHLILDNARYQKCKAVLAVAEELGIFLEYLPAYSPQLNLVERFWKFVKTKLRSQYYKDFDSFKHRIDSVIEGTTKEYRQDIESLIGEKVHLLDDLQPSTAHTYARQPEKAAA